MNHLHTQTTLSQVAGYLAIKLHVARPLLSLMCGGKGVYYTLYEFVHKKKKWCVKSHGGTYADNKNNENTDRDEQSTPWELDSRELMETMSSGKGYSLPFQAETVPTDMQTRATEQCLKSPRDLQDNEVCIARPFLLFIQKKRTKGLGMRLSLHMLLKPNKARIRVQPILIVLWMWG